MSDTSILGRVSSRSSRKAGGPPGESEIGELNPQRRKMILQITGWGDLEPGTLNVECDETDIHEFLADHNPAWLEEPGSVKYPDRYNNIPLKRGGYCYYRAILSCADSRVPVLIRRAVNPLEGRLEVYAEHNLRTRLGICDHTEVMLCIPN